MHKIQVSNEIEVTFFNDQTQEYEEKSTEQIDQEKQDFLDQKTQEIQAEVNAYKQAQLDQIKNGGKGPVARFEIMKIVNEHNGEFEVVFKEHE